VEMPNFIGKLGGFVTSMMSGRDPPPGVMLIDETGDEEHIPSVVKDCQHHLVNAILQGAPTEEIIQNLIMLDCPRLEDKYSILSVKELLELNNGSLQDLKNIITGLNAIGKYAKYLIKEPEKRTGQWRNISFHNTIFLKKIKPFNGFEIILEQLGYTEHVSFGLRFPLDKEPNKSVVVNLIADMLLFRKELVDYLFDKHPHKQIFEELLPQETRDEVMALVLSGLKIEDESADVSGQSSMADYESHYRMSTPSMSLNNVNNSSSHIAGIQNMDSADTNVTKEVTSAWEALPDGAIKDELDAMNFVKEEGTSDKISETQAMQDLVSPQEVPDAVPLVSGECSSSSSSRRLVCSVCGEEATLFCANCSNKHLCDNCNITWHKHPSRQNHKTEPISALTSITGEGSVQYVIDPTYGVCAQTNPNHTKFGKKQQTLVVDQKNDSKASALKQFAPHNVSNLTQLVSEQDYLSGQNHFNRKHLPQQPDDYQILDYQRSQQKQHYPFPSHLPPNMDPYRSVKEPTYFYQQQRSMYPPSQMFRGHQQPILQHLLDKNSDVQEYMLHQVKDQETRHVFHPSQRSGHFSMLGHSNQFHPSQMSPGVNSSFNIASGNLQQSNLLHYNPQDNQNNSYQLPYSIPPPVHGTYLSEVNHMEDFHTAYHPNASFNPHQIPQTYGPGVRLQQNLAQVSGLYQEPQDTASLKVMRRLLQEQDPHKRRTKCETYIEDLDFDLKELDTELNHKLLEIEDFCESENFKEMMKRKTAMMKEKKQLESFLTQLDTNSNAKSKIPVTPDALASKQKGEISQQIFYPPEIEKATMKLNTLAISSFGGQSQAEVFNRTGNITPAVPLLQAASNIEKAGSKHVMGNIAVDLSAARTPVENSPEERYGQLESGHSKESRQIIENPLNRILTPPKPSLLHGLYQSSRWQCEHCTFINDAGSHVCSMCDKTSVNPQLFGSPEERTLSSDKQSETSLGDEDPLQNFLHKMEGENANDIDPDETPVIGRNITGSQEQVMKEKKKAQEEFQRRLQEENKSSIIPQTSVAVNLSAKETQPQGVGARPKESPGQKPVTTLLKEELHTPPPSINRVPVPIPVKVKDSKFKQSSLEDTLAIFNEQKVIDTMKDEGLKLAKLVKKADQEGFDVEAVKVALTFCELQAMTPLDWLRANWKKNVEKVMEMAAQIGNNQQCNNVGELTEEEAGEAYISCHGNIREAAQYCADKRSALFEYLSNVGEFPREEILQCMFQCQGNQKLSEAQLQRSNLQQFHDRIWAQKDPSQFTLTDLNNPDVCNSLSTSVIGHSDFQRMIKDRNIPCERRIRLVLVEGSLKSWGRAELVIKLLDSDQLNNESITLEDIVEAVRNCRDRQSAIAYLQQECQLCFTLFPMSKIRSLNFCQCKMCQECLSENFTVVIREKHVRHWTCPLCSMPDLSDVEVASDYLQFLTLLLQPLIDSDLQNLFETKVRDWHLQKDPNFRWCAHCAEGFLAENRGNHLRMTCPHCGEKTCFSCKKEWEDQHENITCEQFAQWKIDNDPNNQSVGLAKHLDENGIDCPTCKMRFALAKGGCMHFKCPNCGHDFCSGCNEAYHHKDVCNKFKGCKNQGFHCHCPRDCFSFLRDYPVDKLQALLKMHNVAFNVKMPDDQQDSKHCPVMEQKEFDLVKKDERCGKNTIDGQAGLCELHYKEYLVYIINKNKLDPVVLMSKEQMTVLIQRYDLKVPPQKPNEPLETYVNSLRK
ncbi:E3 ubiquitin-protein ligase rnf31, partial [Biomphalaria glabrata]